MRVDGEASESEECEVSRAVDRRHKDNRMTILNLLRPLPHAHAVFMHYRKSSRLRKTHSTPEQIRGHLRPIR